MTKKRYLALAAALSVLMCCTMPVYADETADVPDTDAVTVIEEEDTAYDTEEPTADPDAIDEPAPAEADEDTAADDIQPSDAAAEQTEAVEPAVEETADDIQPETAAEEPTEQVPAEEAPAVEEGSLVTDDAVYEANTVAKPTVTIKTAFGGRTVQFNCADTNAEIYYRFGTSTITTACDHVKAGETIFLDRPMTGNDAAMYFKAYKNGVWSPLAKWGVLNVQIAAPIITQSGAKSDNNYKVYTQTKDSYIIYTLDGTDPAIEEGTQKLKVTNGRIIWGTSGIVHVPAGKTIHARAIRCGLVTSGYVDKTAPYSITSSRWQDIPDYATLMKGRGYKAEDVTDQAKKIYDNNTTDYKRWEGVVIYDPVEYWTDAESCYSLIKKLYMDWYVDYLKNCGQYSSDIRTNTAYTLVLENSGKSTQGHDFQIYQIKFGRSIVGYLGLRGIGSTDKIDGKDVYKYTIDVYIFTGK